ncbi:MAG: oligosaccharide flippase family protein [Vicinamibacterales bacterium]
MPDTPEPARTSDAVLASAARGIWAWGLPAATALVTAPILARGLGAEGFATYALATAYIGFSTSLGIGRAVVREISHPDGVVSARHRRDVASTGLWLSAAVGALMAAALAAGAGSIVRAAAGEVAREAPALRWAALGAIPASIAQVALAILQGVGRWDLFARLSVAAALATSAGAAAFAWSGAGPDTVVLWVIGVSALLAAASVVTAGAVVGGRLGLPTMRAATALGRLGSLVFGTQLVVALWVLAERVMVSRVLGPLALTAYVITLMLGAYLQAAVTAAAQVLTPYANRASGPGSHVALQQLYARASMGIAVLCTIGAATIAGAGRTFLDVWMGADIAAAAAPAVVALAVAFGINGVTTAPWFVGEGLGLQRHNLVASMCAAAIGLAALAALSPIWGMAGAGVARVAAMALAPVYIRAMERAVTPVLHGPWRTVVVRLVPLGVALAAALSGALEVTGPSWAALVMVCLTGWAAFAAVSWRTAIDDADRMALAHWLQRARLLLPRVR